ncbi:MAG: BtpA/SgcQ family protein [Candidatus Eisenbacteria bacterium]|nr:BtpA/SgcQ family protein [Candidatus Eisenbacteria bacterium]
MTHGVEEFVLKRPGIEKPLIGVVHLSPLPGAPGYGLAMTGVIRRAVTDATAYLEGGMHGLLVENFGDRPYFPGRVPAETVAAMAVVTARIRRLGDFPLGVNVLRSDGEAALAVAVAARARFVRVNVLSGLMLTDQGPVVGRAAELLRRRSALHAKVQIWADVLVKHAHPPVPCDALEVAWDLQQRAMADALIVTGPRTGEEADLALLERLRARVKGIPWIVGSGVRASQLERYWKAADGFLVGSSLKESGLAGKPVDRGRVKELTAEHKRLTDNDAASGKQDAGER